MQEPIRPISTSVPVVIYPRQVRRILPGTDEALEAKKRRSEQRQSEQRQSQGTGTEQEPITLHDVIPPELLNIPQVVASQSSALASYRANQAEMAAGGAVTGPLDDVRLGGEEEHSFERQTASAPSRRQNGRAATGGSRSGAGLLAKGLNKAAVDASYRSNDDEPVYVAVPDTVLAAGVQPSKLKTLTHNISNNVKDVYYRLMTMVPYSVGMLINVFA